MTNIGKFLGEKTIDVKDTPFKSFKRKDWVMWFVSHYGSIDGAHHKQWVLDQIAQICLGVKIIIKLAEWENGHSEYRIELDEPNKAYTNWARCYNKECGGWDQGVAP
jgi:hypothetical protein